jgi:hypothetical protein
VQALVERWEAKSGTGPRWQHARTLLAELRRVLEQPAVDSLTAPEGCEIIARFQYDTDDWRTIVVGRDADSGTLAYGTLEDDGTTDWIEWDFPTLDEARAEARRYIAEQRL